MTERHRVEESEPVLPVPPSQIPGIEEMGDGHYLNSDFIQWQIEHGHKPHLENYPGTTIKLLKHQQKLLGKIIPII